MIQDSQLKDKLSDPVWRLNNLYYIKNKQGKVELTRGLVVQVITVYDEETVLVAHEGNSYEIDPRDTYLIYQVRDAINPQKRYVGNDKLYVTFPLGAASFADKTVAYHFGSSTSKKADLLPLVGGAVGEPNKSIYSNNAHLTGCKGLLTLEFVDNVAVDGDGADIYIFSAGKRFYNMHAYVSSNKVDWIQTNDIGNQQATIDLSGYITKGQEIKYIKLVHDGGCSYRGNYIDAVGAINTKLTTQ